MPKIHQEPIFTAPPSRIYEALTAKFAEASGAPTTGESTEGASFSAFGGFVTGRILELVKDRRVVQAWRAKSWPEGLYSVVRFELQPEGKGTKVVFDHTGFPDEEKEHLAGGWQSNYWEKIARYVA
ncbi:MAG TPA: SRPBCC domain-containing protein [Polyangiaceae bacterium]|jgi:activator of HSP90 ATPase|nr:SRPBCC domain-containing protein [Polyangiaceae bacterium]